MAVSPCGWGTLGAVRILSLLPSATEIVYALGLEDDLVGVTHECDWPAAARAKRVVSFSALPPAAGPAEIDQLVRDSIGGGAPIYRLDEDAVRDLRPDVVLTQDLCAVCAVPSGQVNAALEVLGCSAEVVSMDPSSLEDVIECLRAVGAATGTEARADRLVTALHERLERVRHAVAGRARPRTFALEWSDPPFNGGHWVPDMIDAAGATPVLCRRGTPSVTVAWEEIATEGPEVVVFMPCGYDLEQACDEAVSLLGRPELAAAEGFFAVDASAYFSRPGPRLVDGVELLASALHPGTVEPAVAAGIRRLR
jgi:iron complex transport system substrate-binding protein